jgi:hypothetical protein
MYDKNVYTPGEILEIIVHIIKHRLRALYKGSLLFNEANNQSISIIICVIHSQAILHDSREW